MTDIKVENHGTIWLVRPINPNAKAWLETNIDPAADWFGGALVVGHRYIDGLLEGIQRETHFTISPGQTARD